MGKRVALPKTWDREQLASRLKGGLEATGASGRPVNFIPWWYAHVVAVRESFGSLTIWESMGTPPPLPGSQLGVIYATFFLDARWAEQQAAPPPRTVNSEP